MILIEGGKFIKSDWKIITCPPLDLVNTNDNGEEEFTEIISELISSELEEESKRNNNE